jgi:hypothetical protein
VRGSLGLGLVIGAVVGAGAMYLGLRPPWGGHDAAPGDAAVVASGPGDAGVGKQKPKRVHRQRPKGGGGGGGGGVTGGDSDDQAWANQGDSVEETGQPPVQLSAADRAMEWRGDDVSPPARTMDMSNNARPLEQNEIQATIDGQAGAAKQCVTQSVPNAVLQATITVKMVVDAQGRVTRSKLQAPHVLFTRGLMECIKPALARMKFPATGMPTLVTMPINLT